MTNMTIHITECNNGGWVVKAIDNTGTGDSGSWIITNDTEISALIQLIVQNGIHGFVI